ncbi:MAG: hypothetical protein MJ211_04005 [Bacteroidales bacterium]|nr:hypothetical protein [Bacteroidales bacterium]
MALISKLKNLLSYIKDDDYRIQITEYSQKSASIIKTLYFKSSSKANKYLNSLKRSDLKPNKDTRFYHLTLGKREKFSYFKIQTTRTL